MDGVMEEVGRNGGEDREERDFKVFWNVAGLRNKDGEFWNRLGDWDVIMLPETWKRRNGVGLRRGCQAICGIY